MKTTQIAWSILSVAIALAYPPSNRGATNAATDISLSWVEVRSPHFTVASDAGEKTAREVAKQFEEIRAVFHQAFPSLRVDPGKPMLVLAIKSDGLMATLLPEYWAKPGGVHPSGLYLTSFDKDFAILHVGNGTTEDTSYRALYHEYAHAIQRLNFRALPPWLGEGLADFFGNTLIAGTDVELGHVNTAEMDTLRRSTLIPLDSLMRVDRESSLYNEKDRASMFYAESWALVHYLLLDPDASEGQPLLRYFAAFEDKNDAVAAAEQVFGNLTELEDELKVYVHQRSFPSQRITSTSAGSERDLAVREMSRAESLTAQAEFLLHSRHESEATPLLDEAALLDARVASIHISKGYIDYVHFRDDAAEKEFALAAKLAPRDFRPPFYLAELTYRRTGFTIDRTPQITAYLETATKLNPDFAPAQAFLAVAYLQRQETRERALDAAQRAAHLEPTAMSYAAILGNVFMALHREAEALAIGDKLRAVAKTPAEKSIAEEYAHRLARHEQFLAEARQAGETAATSDLIDDDLPPDTPLLQPEETADTLADAHRVASEWTESVTGTFRDVDCASAPKVTVRFKAPDRILRLSSSDAREISYRSHGLESNPLANPCFEWKGRTATITYRAPAADGLPSEITSIDFQ